MSYRTHAPAYWSNDLAGDRNSELTADVCVIRSQYFFVRADIQIPVLGSDEKFAWGVWVSLSEANFERTLELWNEPGRENEPPHFGWLSTELPVYTPSTLQLKTRVHTQPLGSKPLVELEPTEHPLAVEQRSGITLARVQEIAERVMHAG